MVSLSVLVWTGMQFLKCPLEARSKRQGIVIRYLVKMLILWTWNSLDMKSPLIQSNKRPNEDILSRRLERSNKFQKRSASNHHKPLIQLPLVQVQVPLGKVPQVLPQENHSEDHSITEVTEDDNDNEQLTSLVKLEKGMGSYCKIREILTFFEIRGVRWDRNRSDGTVISETFEHIARNDPIVKLKLILNRFQIIKYRLYFRDSF